MDLKDIKKIVELMDEFGLTHFRLEQDESKLELSKKIDFDASAIQQMMASAASAPVAAAPSSPVPAPATPVGSGDDEDALPEGIAVIPSPMVGTFYRSPSPDSDPFVQTGSKVEEDTVVCIIEAMKVMNDIQADLKGEIVEALVENGQSVQYGEPLFKVRVG